MNWQVFDSLGILLGFSANLVASTAGEPTFTPSLVYETDDQQVRPHGGGR